MRVFLWSVFFRIRTEYGEILHICPYSVRVRENTNQEKVRIRTHFTQGVEKQLSIKAGHSYLKLSLPYNSEGFLDFYNKKQNSKCFLIRET